MKQSLMMLASACILCIAALQPARAQQSKVFVATTQDLLQQWTSGNGQSRVAYADLNIDLNSTTKLTASINAKTQQGSTTNFLGEIQSKRNSSFSLHINDKKAEGNIILKEEKAAYRFSSDAQGNVYLEQVDIHDVLCVDFKELPAALRSKKALRTEAIAATNVYALQSLPGSEFVAYLDFDGEYFPNSGWNSGQPLNALPSGMTDADILEAWEITSEDYRPFNLNITTDVSVFNNAAPGKRIRCVITPTNTAGPGYGGIAYIGSFTWTGYEEPCWSFTSGVGTGGKNIGEVSSHELGHTLRLGHDGRTEPSENYYGGAGTWAPIMGVGYYQPVVQWSKGEYLHANNNEDDIYTISTQNGFGFRSDDHANSNAKATGLAIEPGGGVIASKNTGIISERNDIDVFSFYSNGGTINLTFNPAPRHGNLNILARLYNATDNLMAVADPQGLSASISLTIPEGLYYLQIDGTGEGDPLVDGYTDYSSLGSYSISGTIPQSSYRLPDNPPNTSSGLSYSYYEARWTALPDFTALTPVSTGTVANFNFTPAKRPYDFGISYTGLVYAPADGIYTFYTSSDEGSKLYIGSTLVVNNDGIHAEQEAAGQIGLKAGYHTITVVYFQVLGNRALNVSYESAALSKRLIPDNALVHVESIQVENNPPTAKILSPVNHAEFDFPGNVTITADAVDSDGSIVNVEFFNGSTKIGEDNTVPYSFNWNNLPSGNYILSVKATDNKGATTTSQVVNITVKTPPINPCAGVADWNTTQIYDAPGQQVAYQGDVFENKWWTQNDAPDKTNPWGVWKFIRTCQSSNNIAPTVSFIAPISAFFLEGYDITFVAAAADQDGTVQKVEFYLNDVLVTTDTQAPYSYTKIALTPGTYHYKAVVTDNLGATGSALFVLTVDALPVFISPLTNAIYQENAAIVLNIDGKGAEARISKVEYYFGSLTKEAGEVTTAPYIFNYPHVPPATSAQGNFLPVIAKVTYSNGNIALIDTYIQVVKTQIDLCASIPEYADGNHYEAGSVVKHAGKRYECKPWPFSGWCSLASWAYGPGIGSAWQDAWTDKGTCAGNTVRQSEDNTSSSITVFPNPTEGMISIHSASSGLTEVLVIVYDAFGKKVNEQTIALGEQVNLSTYEKGMYTLHLITGDQTTVRKVIKL